MLSCQTLTHWAGKSQMAKGVSLEQDNLMWVAFCRTEITHLT